MIKLNRKGYLTIEIILASVMTVVIAFFLIDLTMKLVDTTDNAYADTVLITDKSLVIKNIKENLKNDMCNGSSTGISTVNCTGNSCTIVMTDGSTSEISVSGNSVSYTGSTNYTKELNSTLSNITLTSSNLNGYYNFKISGENIFIDENYDMNIFLYNEC